MILLDAYSRLVQTKYIEFFSKEDSIYMVAEEGHPSRYIGVAFEFLCEISSADLPIDYNDLYDKVFKDEQWLFVDTLSALSENFMGLLTAKQIVTILAAIRHKELFCRGFFEQCGKSCTIIRLLEKLKIRLEERNKK